jgi:hypothetical protein
MSPKSTKCRSSGVTPTQQQDAHDGNVFRAEAHHYPCPQKVRYDTVVSFNLGLTHESTQTADVEAVHLPVAVSDYVGKGDWYQYGKEDVVYLGRLRADAVEEYGEEADGDMEDFARYLVFMDLLSLAAASSQMSRVYSRRTAIAGEWESNLGDSDSCSFPASNSYWLELAISGHSSYSQAT